MKYTQDELQHQFNYHHNRLKFHTDDLQDVVLNDPEAIAKTLEYIEFHSSKLTELWGLL